MWLTCRRRHRTPWTAGRRTCHASALPASCCSRSNRRAAARCQCLPAAPPATHPRICLLQGMAVEGRTGNTRSPLSRCMLCGRTGSAGALLSCDAPLQALQRQPRMHNTRNTVQGDTQQKENTKHTAPSPYQRARQTRRGRASCRPAIRRSTRCRHRSGCGECHLAVQPALACGSAATEQVQPPGHAAEVRVWTGARQLAALLLPRVWVPRRYCCGCCCRC